jgi:hypothetical protein
MLLFLCGERLRFTGGEYLPKDSKSETLCKPSVFKNPTLPAVRVQPPFWERVYHESWS